MTGYPGCKTVMIVLFSAENKPFFDYGGSS